eukprot:1733407-Rhodomonas_salina.1
MRSFARECDRFCSGIGRGRVRPVASARNDAVQDLAVKDHEPIQLRARQPTLALTSDKVNTARNPHYTPASTCDQSPLLLHRNPTNSHCKT